MKSLTAFWIVATLLLLFAHPNASAQHASISLWPQSLPGQSDSTLSRPTPNEKPSDAPRIKNITHPELIIYEANADKRNGAAIIVCPGGAYKFLAIKKEGYEVAEWLSGLGYTAFVLKYRVPDDRKGALQDAHRAMRYVKSMRHKWHLKQFGFLGFSAGGSLSARASSSQDEMLYPSVDEWDQLSARPDFQILIYPAYLDSQNGPGLNTELKVDADTPPTFLFVTADDPYAKSSLVMASALNENKIPFELHVLPKGGHGYGLRKGSQAAETWPQLCETWLTRHILTRSMR